PLRRGHQTVDVFGGNQMAEASTEIPGRARVSSTIAVDSAAAVAGCSPSLIRALLRRGILTEAPDGGVLLASLMCWLNDRPPALRLPPKIRKFEQRRLRSG